MFVQTVYIDCACFLTEWKSHQRSGIKPKPPEALPITQSSACALYIEELSNKQTSSCLLASFIDAKLAGVLFVYLF